MHLITIYWLSLIVHLAGYLIVHIWEESWKGCCAHNELSSILKERWHFLITFFLYIRASTSISLVVVYLFHFLFVYRSSPPWPSWPFNCPFIISFLSLLWFCIFLWMMEIKVDYDDFKNVVREGYGCKINTKLKIWQVCYVSECSFQVNPLYLT